MADLAILLKLGTNGDRIVVRKASGDPNNSGLEIFRKGPPPRTEKTPGDPRGKETREERSPSGQQRELRASVRMAVSPRRRHCHPDRSTLRAAADKDPSKDLAAHGASTQTPCSSPNRGGSSTRQRLHRLPGTTDNAVGRKAEPRRGRRI